MKLLLKHNDKNVIVMRGSRVFVNTDIGDGWQSVRFDGFIQSRDILPGTRTGIIDATGWRDSAAEHWTHITNQSISAIVIDGGVKAVIHGWSPLLIDSSVALNST